MPEDIPQDAHQYKVTYQLKHHAQGIVAQDVPSMHGASDALIVISQLYLDDGAYSQATSSLDGRTGKDVDSADLWKAWMLLANSLATEHPDLSPGQRLAAWTAFSLASQMVFGKAPEPPPDLAPVLGKLEGLVGYQRRPDGPEAPREPRVADEPQTQGEMVPLNVPGVGGPLYAAAPAGTVVKMQAVIDARKKFADEYAERQGWDLTNGPTMEQILEIRAQPEWKRLAEDTVGADEPVTKDGRGV
jgi:hypothetical protein